MWRRKHLEAPGGGGLVGAQAVVHVQRLELVARLHMELLRTATQITKRKFVNVRSQGQQQLAFINAMMSYHRGEASILTFAKQLCLFVRVAAAIQ